MFRNYFKTAIRNLLKNRFYTFLNIIGLAVGLATCLLIFLYVSDELSYDRFNKDADRIYRVNNEIKFGGNYFDLASTPALMGITMVREVPQVEQYTRLRWYGSFLVKKGSENIQEYRVGYADSTLFNVFTLPVIDGDPNTALKEPHSLVITRSRAMKYFDRTDVVGKTMLINDTGNYKITAVIEDIPAQSHFNFDFFVPMVENIDNNSDNWLSENFNTYIRVKEGTDFKKLVAQLDAMLEKYSNPILKSLMNQTMDDIRKTGGFIRSSVTPVTAIHLHSNRIAELDANGSAQFVYIFSAIALLILMIACVNFMNLSTARSANRAKEVGVRKVMGSLRKNLIEQFLTESLVISVVALAVSILIAWIALPYFNGLAGKRIEAEMLVKPGMMVALVTLIAVVGLLAGSYPAFFLSAFRPIDVLKGRLSGGFKRSWLRNALVVFQFVISIVLIFGTIVIYTQLDYIRNKDVGFDRNQVLTIHHANSLGAQAKTLRNELLQMSGVKNASISGYLPVNFNRGNDALFTSPALDQQTAVSMQIWTVDENYLPTLDVKLRQGRNFSSQFPTDSTGMIINEAAAKFLATNDLLNKKLYRIADMQTKAITEYHVIGVIKNFHFNSLRDVITPLALIVGIDNGEISVRVNTADVPALMTQIRSKWKQMAPGQPLDYTFMDEDFNKLYTGEQRTGKIFVTFAAIAIIIACLGLFGLITYAAEQRVKEIGIRKVLGASAGNIAGMLSKNFLKLVLFASLLAFPLAWWAMNKWLQDFAYRVSIGWWVFAVAGICALVIALATVLFQALKAALANPVQSLRSE